MKIKLNLKTALSWKNIRLNIMICSGITILLTVLFYMLNNGNVWSSFKHTLLFSFSIGFSIYFFMTGIEIDFPGKAIQIFFMSLKLVFSTIFGLLLARFILIIIYNGQSISISKSGLLFLLFSGIIFGLAATVLFYYYHLSEERKYRQLKEQEEKTKAELRALVSQINPHFLFNTLNSISYLIHTDAGKADEMLMKLSDVFRYSLQSGKKRFVSIAEEVKVVSNYLEIEKVRFSERLEYNINVDENCLEYCIPPLILQTLVENSVKHGISPKLEGGEVFLSIKTLTEGIEICIEDNGTGMQGSEVKGFGLNAVKNILELQYEKHDFQLINDNGVKIRMVIPRVKTDEVQSRNY